MVQPMLEQGREPRAQGPKRSHERERRPRGRPELGQNKRNDGHWSKRVSLETAPRMEKHVCAR